MKLKRIIKFVLAGLSGLLALLTFGLSTPTTMIGMLALAILFAAIAHFVVNKQERIISPPNKDNSMVRTQPQMGFKQPPIKISTETIKKPEPLQEETKKESIDREEQIKEYLGRLEELKKNAESMLEKGKEPKKKKEKKEVKEPVVEDTKKPIGSFDDLQDRLKQLRGNR